MKYTSNRDSVEEQLGLQIREQLVATAVKYERILDGMMTEPKSGRLYASAAALRRFARNAAKGKTTRGVHRASAPGEAPAIWMAHLRKGIRHVITRIDRSTWSVQVGVVQESGRTEIAKFLEFGTSKMQPRPMWRPALQILRERLASGTE